jgi:hypothetical protein
MSSRDRDHADVIGRLVMTTQIKELPPLIHIDRLPDYGGPHRTQAYALLKARKLRAVKQGLTSVTGESFAAYLSSLPAYQPGATE